MQIEATDPDGDELDYAVIGQPVPARSTVTGPSTPISHATGLSQLATRQPSGDRLLVLWVEEHVTHPPIRVIGSRVGRALPEADHHPVTGRAALLQSRSSVAETCVSRSLALTDISRAPSADSGRGRQGW